MSKRRKRRKRGSAARPAQMKWAFDPSIPTHDFFEGQDLSRPWDLHEAVESFIHFMECGRFLTWEAVVSCEQRLRLTRQQREMLDGLINFGDPDDDQILYIDEFPRTTEPWYEILRKIVPHLLIEPFRTFDIHEEERCDGWKRLAGCLEEHARHLSLPEGARSALEVVPAELRHKLWLQDCFDELSGLGQEDELTLQREEQQGRIGWFIDRLREHKETVEYFGLTLDSLLGKVILPDQDRPIFLALMQEKLGLPSGTARIADYL